jgi:hypothetical protein
VSTAFVFAGIKGSGDCRGCFLQAVKSSTKSKHSKRYSFPIGTLIKMGIKKLLH